MFIEDSKFEAGRTRITPDIYISINYPKELNLRELTSCTLIIVNQINYEFIKIEKEIQYVYQDQIISFDQLLIEVKKLIQELIIKLRALDSGINLLEDYYISQPGINNCDIEVKNSIIKALENLSDYKLQPYVMELYTILTSYKGSDTLQQRMFKKMIENIEDTMSY